MLRGGRPVKSAQIIVGKCVYMTRLDITYIKKENTRA